MDRVEEIVRNIARLAKSASYKLSGLATDEKNRALSAIAVSLDEHRSLIKAENAHDITDAKGAGMKAALVERLMLNDKRIDDMIASVEAIAKLPDPVGKLITSRMLDNGMELKKIRVPLGVVAIIFESRPNVITDVAALCLKSGNAVILRGGSEALHSNRAIMRAIDHALTRVEFPPFSVQMVPVVDRSAVNYLARLDDCIDVIIPRGGEGLIKAVSDVATVPVIKHYKGVCHVFVDATARETMALSICHNAKCQRPSVCNAVETILVHEEIAPKFVPALCDTLQKEKVEIRGCEHTLQLWPHGKPAIEADWSDEYLDLIVSIKVVKNISEAITHINTYGSHHSDAIVTEDKNSKKRFTQEVDSAAVYVNASTRFTDGFMFGLGAEMGISTDKLHARGPMALEELCTYKWVGVGSGQIRE